MSVGKSAWTEERILREAASWVWTPAGARRVEDAGRLLVHLPWRQSIVHRSSVADEALARAMISSTISEAHEAGSAGLYWWTRPSTSPGCTARLLSESGFRVCEEVEILAFNLKGAVLPDLASPVGVEVEPVGDLGSLRVFHRLGAEVFGFPEPSEQELAAYAAEMDGADTGAPVLSFLARIGGEPVSAAGLGVADGVGRMWGAATLPEFRRRGAYSALVLERCRAARACGAEVAVVKARVGTSGPILRRAGFHAVGLEQCHELALWRV